MTTALTSCAGDTSLRTAVGELRRAGVQFDMALVALDLHRWGDQVGSGAWTVAQHVGFRAWCTRATSAALPLAPDLRSWRPVRCDASDRALERALAARPAALLRMWRHDQRMLVEGARLVGPRHRDPAAVGAVLGARVADLTTATRLVETLVTNDHPVAIGSVSAIATSAAAARN